MIPAHAPIDLALLASAIGPESEIGPRLQALFFDALQQKGTKNNTGANSLYVEWKRLFGQEAGLESSRLRQWLEREGQHHERHFHLDVTGYLFALNTYIALVAKLVAALALPGVSRDLLDSATALRSRLKALEDGSLFTSAGILNMASGNFFSWYLDAGSWEEIEPALHNLVSRLTKFNCGSGCASGDLFRGLYENLVPRELRHALGEVYTPDWLASHALKVVGWQPENDLLDPTCGSGAFVLEALRQRLEAIPEGEIPDAERLLGGLSGIDLNPLAVTTAKAALVVFLAPFLKIEKPLRLPIYQADAINTVERDGAFYNCTLLTGMRKEGFQVPCRLVMHPRFAEIFRSLGNALQVGHLPEALLAHLDAKFKLELVETERSGFLRTISFLLELEFKGLGKLWCSILTDYLIAGTLEKVSHICGNPPWVKWSNLPPEYAEFIKPRCVALGVFSSDAWVGGIESDISTIVTYASLGKWLAPRGKLAFFITGTVFSNESSEGFRRFDRVGCAILTVEDYKALAPFEGVTTHATLLVLEKDRVTSWPVPYLAWSKLMDGKKPVRSFADSADFERRAAAVTLLAQPVPGTQAGPWLKGSLDQHEEWRLLFDASEPALYKARKGITTDANGVFFLRLRASTTPDLVEVENNPALGRRDGIPVVRQLVENEHVFPLLRGRGLSAFSAEIDVDYSVLVPQRGMHGDPDLPIGAPRTFAFLNSFRSTLESRSSFKRFQPKQAWWSLWSTGAYTFSPYKVLWREMSGGRFAAAYTGTIDHPLLGSKIPIADHKLYFVPVETEVEAAFLTAILNAPRVAAAISGYAAQLSLGVSVVEYLRLPIFDAADALHRQIAEMGRALTAKTIAWDEASQIALDALADTVLHRHRFAVESGKAASSLTLA